MLVAPGSRRLYLPHRLLLTFLTLSFAFLAVTTGCGGNSASTGPGQNTPTPSITAISPTTVNAGANNTTLTITGTNFISTSIVDINNSREATTYVSSTQLTATVPASQLISGALLPVAVLNGSTSSQATPINLQVDNPAPVIQSISPTSAYQGESSATITVTGTGFVPTTTIDVNGAARTTTYTSATKVSFSLTSADVTSSGNLSITAVNSAPGGGTSGATPLAILAPPPTPIVTQISPTSLVAGSPQTIIAVEGSGFNGQSVVMWNGNPLSTSTGNLNTSPQLLYATVPLADLESTGTVAVSVNTPYANPSASNSETFTITPPPVPTLQSMNPSAAAIHTSTAVQLSGSGYTTNTKIALNGVTIPTTYINSGLLSATFPASSLAFPGDINVTVSTPTPGGGTSSPLQFTTYLPIESNDILSNPADGLIYASQPSTNSVVGIDPATGAIKRTIFVGSKPNKLALSTNDTQLFVGLDGADSVAQVNLTSGQVVNRFYLGGGVGLYNPPNTAAYLAPVPGSPNSVAVALSNNNGVVIYDSGIPRAKTSASLNVGEGPITFGPSASTLYMASTGIEALSVDSTGITSATTLATLTNISSNSIRYDAGNLYLSNGTAFNASTGAQLGTFYYNTTTAAGGPVVSDSTLGKAFFAQSTLNTGAAFLAFDESTFNLLGSIVLNSPAGTYNLSGFRQIARWGQNGLAADAMPFTPGISNTLYVIQSSLVKDLSTSPADISVSLKVPASSTTGTAISWTATVMNNGPNPATSVTAALTLDSSLIINSVTPSQGSCDNGSSLTCSLGTLASGASATVTISATPTIAGSISGNATISSTSYDPTNSNNQSTASTTATGSIYGAVPALSSISPNLVQSGSTQFTLTVNGSGFNANSVVNLGTTPLTTTFVSSTQLTAQVTASQIANYGWAAITVSNPAPGGGVSQILPLTIYDLVDVPTGNLLFDPYAQLLYATIPGSSTTITGNSIVSINPYTASISSPIAIGSQPTAMAETDDGKYLYVSLSGANSLAQFNLLTQTRTATIPLNADFQGSTTPVAANWLAAMPGSDTALAVAPISNWGVFGIVDISGNTGTFRTNYGGIYEGDDPVFASNSRLYAYDNQTSGSEFYRYSVNSSGVTLIDGSTLNGMGGFAGSLQYSDGLVFGTDGGIINPSTTPPSQAATLSLFYFGNSVSTPTSLSATSDTSLRSEFLMEQDLGTAYSGIARFNLDTDSFQQFLGMPSNLSSQSTRNVISGWPMLRFGQDGLALLSTENPGLTNSATVVMLIRGPFVVPQELQTEGAATLTSSSAPTIAHGSGNTILTLTGSNFLPGVAVTWNGSYRTTTVVDSNHVTVDIPASDLAAAGSATLVATNPGAPASNQISITIQ